MVAKGTLFEKRISDLPRLKTRHILMDRALVWTAGAEEAAPAVPARAATTSNCMKREEARSPVETILWIGILVGFWILLQTLILPRLGVPT